MSFEPSLRQLEADSTPSGTTTLLPAEVPDQRLLCPYYLRYGKAGITAKSCTGNGFLSAHRIKEHLYRKHDVPILCPRCHEIFEKQDTLDAHLQSDKICETQPGASKSFENLLTRQKKEDIRRKSRSNGVMSEEDRFNQIYRILFPDQVAIPYPFAPRDDAEARVRTEFEQHVRARLFTELRAVLVSGVSNDSKYADLQSKMKGLIDNVFDSGLADEVFSRSVNSFKRRRTLAGEDEDRNANVEGVAIHATATGEPFKPYETATGPVQTGLRNPGLATAIDLPVQDTSPLPKVDNCYSGANAYDNELLDPEWLLQYDEPVAFQDPIPDIRDIGPFDQLASSSLETSTTGRKRRASMTSSYSLSSENLPR